MPDNGRMNTSDLTGADLDFWVAQAEGMDVVFDEAGICHVKKSPIDRLKVWSPSVFWDQGGPIIERARITISYDDVGGSERGMWNAYVHECDLMCQDFDSPLVAAMRAFVASKFGEEVPETPHIAKT